MSNPRTYTEWFHGLDIKGMLSEFFPLNVDITEKRARSIIGLPIKNADGEKIGMITDINWETGEWFGRIIVQCNIRDALLDGYVRSMEIRKDELDDRT